MRRKRRQPTRRSVCVYDARDGLLKCDSGTSLRFGEHAPLSAILRVLGMGGEASEQLVPRVLYICSGTASESAPAMEWYREPVRQGWHVELRWEVPARRTATYKLEGAKIDVRHTAAWFGDTAAAREPSAFLAAYADLEAALDREFGSDEGKPGSPGYKHYAPVLLGSPAQTGLDLIDRALPMQRAKPYPAYEYPALPAELRHLIHRNSPQARKELFPSTTTGRSVEDGLPSFYYLDARFAYAGCLRHVPCWFEEHRLWPRHNGEFIPHQPAWYAVAFQVPADWRHVGLLPVKRGDDPESGWEWPHVPGKWHWTWASTEEVALALNPPAGLTPWRVKIAERILFAPSSTPGSDPLKTWAERMTGLWGKAARDGHQPLKDAYRNLVLHPVGSFHRGRTELQHFIPFGGQMPAGAGPHARAEVVDGGFVVRVPAPLAAAMECYDHPEWSAAVWARNRVKLTYRLLSLDPTTLIGCNNDAFYATEDPGWFTHDDGKIGTYRLKGRILAPRPVPLDWRALLALKAESEVAYAREVLAHAG